MSGCVTGAGAAGASAAPNSPPFGSSIEGYAPYEGQTRCVSAASPGVIALQDLVTRAYPQFGRGGTLRACAQGGQSEHKDGRALDWMVNVNVPAQKAAADELLTWLTEPDAHGNRDARLRRMGVMYVIWNHAVFRAYGKAPGWYHYTGASPHTDHVHFSLGWAGARQATSWWQRTNAPTPAVAASAAGLDLVTRASAGDPSLRSWTPGTSLGARAALGGTLVGGIGAATLADGSLVVAGRGTDDQLYTGVRTPAGSWTGWTGHGGVLTSKPAVAARPDGGVDIAVRGSDGQVHLRASEGAAWRGWTVLGGTLSAGSGPALVHVAGRTELVVAWSDDGVRRRTRTGSTWGPWVSLGGSARGDVAAAGAADGSLVLAVRGSDAGGWVRTVGARDSGWSGIGGVLSSAPAVTSSLDGSRQDVIVQGTDGRLFRAARAASAWTAWELLG